MTCTSNTSRPAEFADIQYTQKCVNIKLSNVKISMAETYAALALGFLDARSLPKMVVFHFNNQYWCRDTRRLTIARALERNGDLKALEEMQITFAEESDPKYKDQYDNLIYARLPSVQSKKLDGKNVIVRHGKGPTCCFHLESNEFRDDLLEHILSDHLRLKLADFQSRSHYDCDRCHKNTQLQFIRTGTRKQRKNYRIKRRCGCTDDHVALIDKDWQEAALHDMVDALTI